MPENEFEKEVQQKIVGLKLKPNDEVWQNVAGAITKRKAGRRLFAFILFLLFFSTAGLFIVYKNTKQHEKSTIAVQENIPGSSNTIQSSVKKEEAHAKPIDASNDNGPAVKRKIVADNVIKQKKDGEPTTSFNQSKLLKPQLIVETSITQKKVQELTTSVKQSELSNPQPFVKKIITQNKKKTIIRNQFDITDLPQNGSEKIRYKKKQKLGTKISSGSVEEYQSETTTVAGNENKNVEEDAITAPADSAHKYITVSPLVNSTDKNIPSVKDTNASLKKSPEKTNAVAKKSIHIKQTSKWKLGVNFSAGVSATSNQYLGIIGSSNSDANKAYADQSPSSVTGSQPGSRIVYYPSKINAAAGFTAGIFVQKNITSKTKLSIGLNYKTYTATMRVGSSLDSIIPANNYLNLSSAAYTFYRTGSSSQYKSHFQFIELPVALNIALNKQHKRAVYLTTGIAVAKLISSNALQFDTTSGKYYNNNNLLNKTQANVSIGVLLGLSRMAKNPLLIGPEINFSLNKIARENLYGGRRYSFFGLRLQKNFGKK